jgi:hypothetical protein
MERVLFASAELGQYASLLRAQTRWAGTAEAYAGDYRPVGIEENYSSGPVARP